MARFVSEGMEKLSEALNENSPLAKQELHSHLNAIRMFPTENGEGRYYIAEGTWDLLGTDPMLRFSAFPPTGVFEWLRGVDWSHAHFADGVPAFFNILGPSTWA